MSVISNIKSWLTSTSYSKVHDLAISSSASLTDDEPTLVDVNFAKEIRELVRYASVNSPDMASLITSQVSGVIGVGINIQSRTKNAQDNEAIEDIISRFSEAKMCDTTGRWHLNSFWRSLVEFNLKEGGLIVRHHYNPEWELGYKVELISISMIDVSKGTYLKNVTNGVKTDKYGTVVGLYIYDDVHKKTSSLVDTENLTYFFDVWVSIGQYTAVSKLASVLPSISQLDEYGDSELTAAIQASGNALYWKTAMYDDLMAIVKKQQELAGQRTKVSTLMGKISAQVVKPTGLTPIPMESEIVDVSKSNSSIYDSLNRSTKTKISSALGTGSQLVYQTSEGATYSSLKSIMAFAQINWGITFDNLEVEIMTPMIKNLIRTNVTNGNLVLNEGNYFLNPRQYHKLQFMRLTNINIEPTKQASADKTNLENRTFSRREIAAQRGRNIEDINREIIEDEIALELMRTEMFLKAGVELPTTVTTQQEEISNEDITNEN